MLKVENLHVSIQDTEILKGINLEIKSGETHAIMGQNGSGKSTLTKAIVGHPDYQITQGNIFYQGRNLCELEVEERALEGIFMAFQYPVEIPGVNNTYFLRMAYNALRKHRGEKEVDSFDFMKLIKEEMKKIKMKEEFLTRSLNEGFSGGEKKRNEILQLSILKPKLALLDETDSGLDIDALKIIAECINQHRDAERSFLLITHYRRLLDYVVPDHIHIMLDGRIVKSGGSELAEELEKVGYDYLKPQ